MKKKLVFLHTVPSLVTLFNDLSKELLPSDLDIFHIADEMLLKLAMERGELFPWIYRRVGEHAAAAQAAGADVVQVTCSSISPCVDVAQALVSIPILKIDTPMVDQALELGRRIGVAATVSTTLKPTRDLVWQRAGQARKKVEVEAVLCEGAYPALMRGDLAAHDEIVGTHLTRLRERNDVVLLAQASMARVAAGLPPAEGLAPVLSSPRLAVEHLREVLAGL